MVKKKHIKTAGDFFVNISASHYAVVFIEGLRPISIAILSMHMILAITFFLLSVYTPSYVRKRAV